MIRSHLVSYTELTDFNASITLCVTILFLLCVFAPSVPFSSLRDAKSERDATRTGSKLGAASPLGEVLIPAADYANGGSRRSNFSLRAISFLSIF
ncbi:hypothetical protein H6G94_01455 [Nostoc punctiforme FACHB-252]|uniref:Uncharacterized protein n=1 Tax=Nostoc punctiforme FACHB-252 TaxID=1357509 RepID=A0ABR8H3Y6_NOSPU|nr:hypothetical protein [Nostoc punctiforme]MBD2609951.1 hypothetical protein [Nostoc punctiforme FACHB-252]